jgi:hypothetical protein
MAEHKIASSPERVSARSRTVPDAVGVKFGIRHQWSGSGGAASTPKHGRMLPEGARHGVTGLTERSQTATGKI